MQNAKPAIDRYRDAARKIYSAQPGGPLGPRRIDVDRFAKVSTPLEHGTNSGRWVEAWVWVPNEEVNK